MEPTAAVDLSNFLREWPYENGDVNVRLVRAEDGRLVVQMRVDLGILQMELSGRPDGQRPQGCESWLDFYQQLQAADVDPADVLPADEEEIEEEHTEIESEIELPHDPDTDDADDELELEIELLSDEDDDDPHGLDDDDDDDESLQLELELDEDALAEAEELLEGSSRPDRPDGQQFRLRPTDCRNLREEAIQYYHRYVSLFVLEDYDRVIRDTTHNLSIIDLCGQEGDGEYDREIMEQIRPHTVMMRTRAEASKAMADNETRAALDAIDAGINEICEVYRAQGIESQDEINESGEIQLLMALRETLVPKLPISQRSELQNRLRAALASENYELAAILRDELRMLREM